MYKVVAWFDTGGGRLRLVVDGFISRAVEDGDVVVGSVDAVGLLTGVVAVLLDGEQLLLIR